MEGELCRVNSATCLGLDVVHIIIEVSVSRGVGIYLVGLPDSAVREALLRVSTSLQRHDYRIPGRRVVINLAPADLRKEGTSFDLAIALGILTASGQIAAEDLAQYLILGEMALDGSLRKVNGALPIALKAAGMGFRKLMLPVESAAEAAEADGVEIYGVSSLGEAVALLADEESERFRVHPRRKIAPEPHPAYDLADVKGQYFARRGLEISASGGHNLLLNGAPGSGKSMMAKCLPSILPPMSRGEALETSMIYSVAGLLESGGLMTRRPFRSPHHSSSLVSFTGGGANAMPGEISLAQNGVLYLDEMPHFSRALLDMLRQPLEDGCISIARARYKVVYPASFMLVASMNPCPCGYAGEEDGRCTCSPGMIARYLSRISGPLMDRMDLNVKVRRVEASSLSDEAPAESSSQVGRRVTETRSVQLERFAGRKGIYVNAQMGPEEMREFCRVGTVERQLLEAVVKKYGLSARSYDRILKIARTIADMEKSRDIKFDHISEALQYRFQENV